MKLFLLFFLFFTVNSSAQQQVLLRINAQGEQEAIPIKRGESVQAAIERISNTPVSSFASPNGIVDKIKNYDSTATASNFGFNHQEVALSWFKAEAEGVAKNIVWHNYGLTGDIGKASIRAWKVDPRLDSLPPTAGSGGARSAIGYYIDSADGDGNVTSFKDKATNKTFVHAAGYLDSLYLAFDPLGTESKWHPGGLQVKLDSAKWQGIDILGTGDSIVFKKGELFGFTIQNDSPPGGADARMEMWAYGNTKSPYHSLKFYEAPRTGTGSKGWHIRGDFEWQIYVLVEYSTSPAPRITLQKLFTTLSTSPRTVKVTIQMFDQISSVDLYAKINNGQFVKSAMTGTSPNYSGTLPAANPKDTLTYYVVAKDINSNSGISQTYSYTIFQPTKNVLYLYNGRAIPSGFTVSTIAPYYMVKDSITEAVYYDTWDVKNYGTTDIPQLLTNYKLVNEVAGDGGYADLMSMAGTFLSGGTPTAKRAWIFADQDHGFISSWDTSFSDNNPHAKYFGLRAIINQDYTNGIKYPWEINVDSAIYTDPVFGFIGNKIKKDTVKFWYEPYYEVSSTYSNWMDEITPTADATVLFRDKNHGNKVLGVTKKAADNSWYTYALMFDYLGTNFRSDTTGGHTTMNDSKYKYSWIVNAGHVMKNALAIVTGVEKDNSSSPSEFALYQNYPNPFNPTTVISYRLSVNSLTTLKVYDLLGKEVATLVNEKQNSGMHSVTFAGTKLSTGVYFYRLQSGSFVETKKLLLLK